MTEREPEVPSAERVAGRVHQWLRQELMRSRFRPGEKLKLRQLAEELGVSLGAINFCVKALIDKGHIKLANFKASKNKLGYVYVLTPEGIAHRAKLAAGFIKRKMAEFEAIQAELDQLRGEFADDPAGLARK